MKWFLFVLAGLSFLLDSCNTVEPPTSIRLKPRLPHQFCYVDEVTPTVRVDLKYAGSDNFVGRPMAGYEGKRAILRQDAAEALGRASALLEPRGLGLLIWDAYRPAYTMKDFYAWSQTPDDRMRSRFYPRITKRDIYAGKYIGLVSEHSWGIAVDITLVDLKTGDMLDMGGHHDLLDVSSATDYPGLTSIQRAHRKLLCETMQAVGFRNYSKEWWHYFFVSAQPLYSYNFAIRDDLAKSVSN